MARKKTNQLYDLINNGYLDAETVLTACLKYMSEDEVADMMHMNEFCLYEDEEEL